MGKFSLELNLDILIKELKLNKNFKIKDAKIESNFDNLKLKIIIEHNDLVDKEIIPRGQIIYKRTHTPDIVRIDKIKIDSEEKIFEGIDYAEKK